jgi:hypothetical protein
MPFRLLHHLSVYSYRPNPPLCIARPACVNEPKIERRTSLASLSSISRVQSSRHLSRFSLAAPVGRDGGDDDNPPTLLIRMNENARTTTTAELLKMNRSAISFSGSEDNNLSRLDFDAIPAHSENSERAIAITKNNIMTTKVVDQDSRRRGISVKSLLRTPGSTTKERPSKLGGFSAKFSDKEGAKSDDLPCSGSRKTSKGFLNRVLGSRGDKLAKNDKENDKSTKSSWTPKLRILRAASPKNKAKLAARIPTIVMRTQRLSRAFPFTSSLTRLRCYTARSAADAGATNTRHHWIRRRAATVFCFVNGLQSTLQFLRVAKGRFQCLAGQSTRTFRLSRDRTWS